MMYRFKLLTTLFALPFAIFTAAGFSELTAADWPNYRGPMQNGISEETQWRKDYGTQSPPVLWRASVGVGFSSMVANGTRVYTMGHQEGQDYIQCIDASNGKSIWKHSYESDLDDRFFEGGPTSTPTLDGDRVYALARHGDLFCLDAQTGELRWHKNLANDEEVRVPGWGFAGSPVVVGDHLLLNVGSAGMLLHKNTGETVWKSAEGEAGYMTPLVFKEGTNDYALIASGKQYHCVRLDSGEILWKHRWLTTYGCNAASPILRNQRLFLSSGYGRGAALLQVDQNPPRVLWSHKELSNQMNSSVLVGDHLYGFDGDENGEVQLRCVEFETGHVRWSHPGLGSGSLMAADNHLILLSSTGELLIAPANPDSFKPSTQVKVMEGKCWTVPVLCHSKLFCRNAAGDLLCLDLRQPN